MKIPQRIKCFLGFHNWDNTEDGNTGDKWIACHYCLKEKRGSYKEYVHTTR